MPPSNKSSRSSQKKTLGQTWPFCRMLPYGGTPIRDLLESEGFRVYLAPGGREALNLFAAKPFDGVFTDVGMPGMSGWELAHAIRQRNRA